MYSNSNIMSIAVPNFAPIYFPGSIGAMLLFLFFMNVVGAIGHRISTVVAL